jgi:DNA-directed RNA polymerase specialized sigma24 family protein
LHDLSWSPNRAHGGPAQHATPHPQPHRIAASGHSEPPLEQVRAVPTATAAELRRRGRSATPREALALAALKRYEYERRSQRNAAPHRFDRTDSGSARSTSRFDARIVRCIDVSRVLEKIGSEYATLLTLYHVHGESEENISLAIHRSIRSIVDALPRARQALAEAMEQDDLI